MSFTNNKYNIKVGTVDRSRDGGNHKTRMCKNIQQYGKCQYNPCIFAHSLSELRIPECNYGENCVFTTINNGVCCNSKNDQNKVCYFRHSETDEQYHSRVGNTKTPSKFVPTEMPALCVPVKDPVERKEVSIQPKKLNFEGETWTKIVKGKKKVVVEEPAIVKAPPPKEEVVLHIDGSLENIMSLLTTAINEKVGDITLKINYN